VVLPAMYFFNTVTHNLNKMLEFIIYINLAYVAVGVETYKQPFAAMNHKYVVVPNIFVVWIVPAVTEFVGLNRKDCIAD
jgi:hypothetical protein